MKKRGKVILGFLLLAVLSAAGIYEADGAEHQVRDGGGNDLKHVETLYGWDKMIYQATSQKEIMLEADVIAAHPVMHYPIWIKRTESYSGGENQGEYSFAGRYMDAAKLISFVDRESWQGHYQINWLTNMMWEE